MDTARKSQSNPDLMTLSPNEYNEGYPKPTPRKGSTVEFDMPSFNDFQLDTSVFLNSGAPSSSTTTSSAMSSPNPQLDDEEEEEDDESDYDEDENDDEKDDAKPMQTFNQSIFANSGVSRGLSESEVGSEPEQRTPKQHSPTQRSPTQRSPDQSPRTPSSDWLHSEGKVDETSDRSAEVSTAGAKPVWRPVDNVSPPRPAADTRRPSAIAHSTLHPTEAQAAPNTQQSSRRPSAVAHSALHPTSGQKGSKLVASGRMISAAAQSNMLPLEGATVARPGRRPSAVSIARSNSMEPLNEHTSHSTARRTSRPMQKRSQSSDTVNVVTPLGIRRPSAGQLARKSSGISNDTSNLDFSVPKYDVPALKVKSPTISSRTNSPSQSRRGSETTNSQAVSTSTAAESRRPSSSTQGNQGTRWRPTDNLMAGLLSQTKSADQNRRASSITQSMKKSEPPEARRRSASTQGTQGSQAARWRPSEALMAGLANGSRRKPPVSASSAWRPVESQPEPRAETQPVESGRRPSRAAPLSAVGFPVANPNPAPLVSNLKPSALPVESSPSSDSRQGLSREPSIANSDSSQYSSDCDDVDAQSGDFRSSFGSTAPLKSQTWPADRRTSVATSEAPSEPASSRTSSEDDFDTALRHPQYRPTQSPEITHRPVSDASERQPSPTSEVEGASQQNITSGGPAPLQAEIEASPSLTAPNRKPPPPPIDDDHQLPPTAPIRTPPPPPPPAKEEHQLAPAASAVEDKEQPFLDAPSREPPPPPPAKDDIQLQDQAQSLPASIPATPATDVSSLAGPYLDPPRNPLRSNPLRSNPVLLPSAAQSENSQVEPVRKTTPDPPRNMDQWPLPAFPLPPPDSQSQTPKSTISQQPVPELPTEIGPPPMAGEKMREPTPKEVSSRDSANDSLLSKYMINVKLAKVKMDDLFQSSSNDSNDVPDDGQGPMRLQANFMNINYTPASTRRSWMPSSRNQPSATQELRRGSESKINDIEKAGSENAMAQQRSTASTDQERSVEATKQGSKTFSRATNYLSRMKPKQSKAPAPKSTVKQESENTNGLGLIPSLSHSTASSDSFNEEFPYDSPAATQDPLWRSFKNLHSEYRAFASKHTTQRMLQVQSWVLPFLRKTKDNTSIKTLSPEDIERRAGVLDKWWALMLEMLDGQGKNSVTSMDRPFLFDALTMIMERDEWRQATPYFLPFNSRPSPEAARPTTNSAGLAEYNVRTMFAANLIRQMSFVVDKMSQRHASSSQVKFAGMTCAYAFFFAPGVGEVLTRLWALTPDLIRRASDELGLPRRNDGKNEQIVSIFPPKLAGLGWTSPKAMANTMKQSPRTPTVVATIPWTGPWVGRWKGQDSDLLFIFCKYYHIFCQQLLPQGLPMEQKARTPGFVLVHAQILSIIDATIRRQTAFHGAGNPAAIESGLGIDGLPSSSSSSLCPNVMKDMSDNRLIVLLRKFLMENSVEHAIAKKSLADACARMLKAAALKTSQFDSAVCHSLCDYLEEFMRVYDQYESLTPGTKYFDWDFWLEALKRMLDSMSSTLEVRVFAFLYSNWEMVVKTSERKLSVCKDWLLSEEIFSRFFNNWCPMVRGYYHRLLCWRVCRDEGKVDEVQLKIYRTIALRLKANWAHHLYIKRVAEEKGRVPPATEPMLPMQGKKFVIVRQDTNSGPAGLLLDFDSFAKSGVDVISADEFVDESMPKPDKKRRSLLGKVLSLTASGGLGANTSPTALRDYGGGYSRKGSYDDELAQTRRETAESRTRSVSGFTSRLRSDSRASSPALEEEKTVFRFALANHNPTTDSQQHELGCPHLPAPAQLVITMQSKKGNPLARIANDERCEPSVAVVESSDSSSIDSSSTMEEPEVQPIKPVGTAASTVVYSGRALAEWAQAVAECNNFVDRRCDEGVTGLRQVEVPILGVEGFRRMPG